MSVRDDIAATIRPFLPATWDVRNYTDEPEVLETPLVMVNLTAIRPGLTFRTFAADVTLYVLIPTHDDAEANEDAALDALMPVLDSLYSAAAVEQGEATSGLFPPAFPCWQINLTLQNVRLVDDDPNAEEA